MLIVVGVLVAIVVLLLLGVWAVGLVVSLLWWALGGIAVGALARLILPGKQQIGILATAGAGIAAALLGGIIGHLIGVGNVLQFVIAVVAAVIIVAVISTSETARA